MDLPPNAMKVIIRNGWVCVLSRESEYKFIISVFNEFDDRRFKCVIEGPVDGNIGRVKGFETDVREIFGNIYSVAFRQGHREGECQRWVERPLDHPLITTRDNIHGSTIFWHACDK